MEQKAGSKLSTATRRKRVNASEQPVTMLVMSGDPTKVFSRVKLPADAKVAIVSSKPGTVQLINKQVAGKIVRAIVGTSQPPPDPVLSKAPIVDRTAFEPDARSRALLSGVRMAQEDLRRSGGAFELDEVRALMRGVSRQAVDKRVKDGSLLAVPGPSNGRSYPTMQFRQDGTPAPGLKAVRAALQTNNPWVVLNFLAQPDARLGNRKPIDVLKAGNVDLVVQAAMRHGEQGA